MKKQGYSYILLDLDGTITDSKEGLLESYRAGLAAVHFSDYTEELAAKHAVNAYDKPVSAAYFSELAQEVFGAFLTGANHTEEGAVS